MAPARSPRIFIVEDEQFLQEMYKDVLPPQGFQIVGMVGDGDHDLPAISALKECPDFVILDHRLPGKCGLDVMVEFAEHFPHVKVMMISADTAVCGAALKAGDAPAAAMTIPSPFRRNDRLRTPQASPILRKVAPGVPPVKPGLLPRGSAPACKSDAPEH